MKSVRVERLSMFEGFGGTVFAIDIVCSCDRNWLMDEATAERSFKHIVFTNEAERKDKVLVCDCGKKYRLHPQTEHVHISSE